MSSNTTPNNIKHSGHFDFDASNIVLNIEPLHGKTLATNNNVHTMTKLLTFSISLQSYKKKHITYQLDEQYRSFSRNWNVEKNYCKKSNIITTKITFLSFFLSLQIQKQNQCQTRSHLYYVLVCLMIGSSVKI